ncbi:hypothetical protein L7F22_025651 [Adiantum nelumboides]|nr:hypothetical protein [Adiantum nelumboides]
MANHESNMHIVSEKLTEDNFHTWMFRITNYLKGKGYWDYVEGANEAPPVIPDIGASVEQVKSLKEWHQGSTKVMCWLSISVLDSTVGHIQDAYIPKDAWDNLIAFNATNTRARKTQLKNELNTIKKGCKDAWDNLIAFNATNTRARKTQLKNELNTIKKGDLSMNNYTLEIKAFL